MTKKIFWNKFAFWAIFYLLIQQLIVASSTIWISCLSEAVVEGKSISLYLGLFIGSLFSVYIPGIISAFNLEKAKSKALYQYTYQFSEAYKCTPTNLSEKEFQHEKEPWLTSESSKVIDETYGIAYDSIATGLNTILNIAALCLAINNKILIGYLLSFIVLFFVSKNSKSTLAKAAISLQNNRKNISQLLLSGWDNIIIGNNYNLSLWWRQFSKQWGSYNESSANAALLTQLSSTLTVALSLIPVAGIFILLFFTTSSIAKMSALVATLPRQIQITQHFQILSTYTMHWHGVYARIKALISSITIPAYNRANFLKRIKENQITIHVNNSQKNLDSFDCLMEMISKIEPQRITIQGPNGTGKTTLINLIKTELNNRAFYLPINSRLAFKNTLDSAYSTGQRIKANLEELKTILLDSVNFSDKYQKTPQQVLLLDEWDANLDTENKEKISAMLDELAKHHCIVEISHRQVPNNGSL